MGGRLLSRRGAKPWGAGWSRRDVLVLLSHEICRGGAATLPKSLSQCPWALSSVSHPLGDPGSLPPEAPGPSLPSHHDGAGVPQSEARAEDPRDVLLCGSSRDPEESAPPSAPNLQRSPVPPKRAFHPDASKLPSATTSRSPRAGAHPAPQSCGRKPAGRRNFGGQGCPTGGGRTYPEQQKQQERPAPHVRAQ